MFLTSTNAVHYLLERGKLGARAVVRGDVSVVETHRRNRNFKVLSSEPPSLFLKQVREPGGDAAYTVSREAALLRRIADDPAMREQARFTPHFIDFDRRRLVLVLEHVDGESVHEHMAARRSDAAAIGGAFGERLGACHGDEASQRLSLIFAAGAGPPWALHLADGDPAILPRMSPAHRAYLALLRGTPGLAAGLSALRAAWRPDGLVHNDIKLDNMIWAADGRLVLADWELADRGDVDWDAGAALEAFLVPWLLAVPWGAGASPVEALGRAPFALDATRAATRAFWRAYLERRRVHAAQRPALRDRCVRLAAARLLQTGFELQQGRSALTPRDHALLACAARMLREPAQAGSDLFGLTDDGE